MSPSRAKGKQKVQQSSEVSISRPRTRTFAKSQGIPIPNPSYENLARAEKGLSRIPRSGPHLQPLSVTAPANKSHRPSRPSPDTANDRISDAHRKVSNNSRKADAKLSHKPQIQIRSPLPSRQNTGAAQTITQRQEQLQQATVDKTASVSDWLRRINPEEPNSNQEQTPASEPSSRHSPSNESDMATSSSVTNSSAANNDLASAKASTAKPKPTFKVGLTFRAITQKPSPDPKLAELHFDKTVQNVPRGGVSGRELRSLLKMLRKHAEDIETFVENNAFDDGFFVYDSLRQAVFDWRPKPSDYRRFPSMTHNHFEWDKAHCQDSTEADLRATIMLSAIDRYDFREMFEFSCEEQWRVDRDLLIPSSEPDSKISQPKPDLAIYFQRGALDTSPCLRYPLKLGTTLYPGGNDSGRWFPFLFMEVKRNDASLTPAFEKNLYSASQALYNIYQWMKQDDELLQKFFRDVRVFCITVNNARVVLTMHRAERFGNDDLRYEFTEVVVVPEYDRFVICHLIKSVLIDYASQHLHSRLLEAYNHVGRVNKGNGAGAKRNLDTLNQAQNDNGNDEGEATDMDEEQSTQKGAGSTTASFELGQMGIADKRNTTSHHETRNPVQQNDAGNPSKRGRLSKKPGNR